MTAACGKVADDFLLYAREGGLLPTPAVRAMAVRYLVAGMEEGVLYAALDDTQLAPAPSWRYFAAILRNLAREECYTLEAYNKRQEAFEELKALRKNPLSAEEKLMLQM